MDVYYSKKLRAALLVRPKRNRLYMSDWLLQKPVLGNPFDEKEKEEGQSRIA
jgi:hypothetical protein